MAFLGGLQGLGALAGGIDTGIGQGVNLSDYLKNQQANTLAGNTLQSYGGVQPSTGGGGLLAGLGNLFGGGQQASAPPAAAQPLSGLGAAAQTPSTPQDVPGGTVGQPGTASPGSNLFGGGQQAQPGMSPLSMQQPSLANPPPAQAQPQGDQSAAQSQSQPQPFQTNQSQGIGGQQQMTLPQFVQFAKKVNPNASGDMIYRAATHLAQGGLLGYGGMTPYQSAQLALEAGLHSAQIENIQSEIEKRKSDTANQGETQSRERDKEADTQADKGVTEAQSQLGEAKSALNENATAQDRQRSTLRELVGQATSMGKEIDEMPQEWHAQYNDAQSRLATLQAEEKDRQQALKDAQANLDKSKAERQQRAAKAAKEYGRGAGSNEPDYVHTPDGKMMHYKGTGPRDDPGSYEEVQ